MNIFFGVEEDMIILIDYVLILILLFTCIAENLITELILALMIIGYFFFKTVFCIILLRVIRDAYWPLRHRFGVLSTKLCYHFCTTN